MNENLEQIISDTNAELTQIKKWVNQNPLDSKVKFLVLYSIIKSCGSLETIFKQMLYAKLASNANQEATTFLEKKIIDSSTNPSTGNIQRILQDIKKEWNDDFIEEMKRTPEKKSDLNSLVQLRNDFAHGSSTNTSIQTIIRYFNSGIEILRKLDFIINNQ